MDEGEVTQLHQLGVAMREGRHLHRNTGQNGDGPLGGGGGGGKKGRIPGRRRQGEEGCMGRDFLDKGKVGAMRLKKRAQAGEVSQVIGVEGEEGEERPRGLAIISMSRCRHLG